MSRALLICPEPVRGVTAGVGTRFLTFARTLAEAGHGVTLVVPNDPVEAGGVPSGVDVVRAEEDRLGAAADGHDWVLLHGHLGNFYLCQRDDLPVVVDLYDPYLVENLHYHRELGLEPYITDHATWALQMARGDLFLCSSEEQRLFYLGWLGALGRVNPFVLADDASLRQLIVEVPFGTEGEAAPPQPDRGSVLPDVAADAPVLYFGGLYDWYDPMVVLEALPRLLEADPLTVLLFVEHPHRELHPESVAGRVRELARRRGWLGSAVRFVPWQPWEHRFDAALAADLAVVTHRPGLETDLSLRTRLVDLLWLGLPVVVTAGGTMGRVVREIGAGEVVPAGDPEALAAAVLALLADPGARARAGEAGRGWAAARSWERVSAPLLDFARRPWRDPHRKRCVASVPGLVEPEDPLRVRARRFLRRQLRRLGRSQ